MVDEDAEAFEPLAKAYRMPKETEEEQAEKEKVMEAALKKCGRSTTVYYENNCRYYGDDPGAGGKKEAGLQSVMQELQSSLPRQPLKELLLIFLSIQR